MRLIKNESISFINAVVVIFILFTGVSLSNTALSQTFAHTIAAPKILVDDMQETQAFYERVFGMNEEVSLDEDDFSEVILGFGQGATLALVRPNPSIEGPLEKTEFPEIFISTPDAEFDGVMERLRNENVELFFMPVTEGVEPPRGVIAEDPSGNRIEIFAREGGFAVTGVKVVVDDIEEAELFYAKFFNAKPQTRYGREGVHSAAVLSFPEGLTLGLYQPLSHPMLPKSEFPLVLFYSTEFDSLVALVKEEGIEHRVVEALGMTILLMKDPFNNWLEVIEPQ